MPVLIPLQAIPSQIVSVLLNSQACTINVYQKSTGMFCDLLVNNVLIIGGVICQNLNVIVRNAYFGFLGDLAFADSQGSDDPYYTGLGSRWNLYYFLPSELPAGVA